MGQLYTVEEQFSRTYVDGGQPVAGFEVRARIHKWNELVVINVPRLDAELIDARIQELIAQREQLDALGG